MFQFGKSGLVNRPGKRHAAEFNSNCPIPLHVEHLEERIVLTVSTLAATIDFQNLNPRGVTPDVRSAPEAAQIQTLQFVANSVQFDPNSLSDWQMLVVQYTAAGDLPNAIYAQLNVVQLEPQNVVNWQLLASQYTSIGDQQNAISAQLHVVELTPNDVAAWKMLVSQYTAIGDLSNAIAAQIHVTQLIPDDVDAWRTLVRQYTEIHDLSNAIYAQLRVVQLVPNEVAEWRILVSQYVAADDLPNATTAQLHVVELAPDDVAAWRLLVDQYTRLGDLSNATAAQVHVVELTPDDVNAWKVLVAQYSALHDLSNAIYAQLRVVQLVPNDVAEWRVLVSQYIAAGDLPNAITAQLHVVELAPDDVVAWHWLVTQYSQAGDLQNAITAQIHVVQLSPTDVGARETLVSQYMALGDLQNAVYAQLGVIALAPTADNYLLAAKMYISLHQIGDAAFALGKVEELTGIWHSELFELATPVEIANYIIGLQLPNGGIRTRSGPSDYDVNQIPYYLIDPYFADLAISGLIVSPLNEQIKREVVEKYLNWHLANTLPDGTILRTSYYQDGSPAPLALPSDADDSAAATFLYIIGQYYDVFGATAFFSQPGLQTTLERIADVMINLQDSDGLTWAFANYHLKQMADNSEVYAGLMAISRIEDQVFHNATKSRFYADHAAQCQMGILNVLYDSTTRLFDIKLLEGAPVLPANFDYWYSDYGISSLIVWPAMWGVVSPTSPIARFQFDAINSHWNGSDPLHPDWTTRTDFGAYAYAAVLNGDRIRALAHYNTLAQGPFPTTHAFPSDALFTVADAGFMLRSLVPAANDDFARIVQGKSVAIEVKANDFDLNTAALDLTVRIESNPRNGIVVVQQDGTIRYTSKGKANIPDRFTYSVTNELGLKSIAAVTINPANATYTPKALPDTRVGVVYKEKISVISAVAVSFNFHISDGTLPPGILLSKDGRLDGVATSKGTFKFAITASNTNGTSDTFRYRIKVAPASHRRIAMEKGIARGANPAPRF